ncbi:hypothetical protein EHI8A_142340 [Entamoeba histolytica HM-1:IMSS-B]|uniref:Transmembrane protein n=5 Tax=Entamoeba histolytica TaxID=5759 RepID=C4LSA8_ENTH1|nr:hypothetical protein EHI_153160 [Entamoeba histolytica HM-1:IMSS]EAL51014.1 hypothetical protein EHI_153160 [Entamoeba histolytica HM-1:IMSS]EMH73545.1 hypothetical protein EHI8A_142340 [Entamoeba histolytica HM-1:IMSS-B]ENY61299.1 hypothetical protein EHI7A_130770 [Entamoeba histolytica HM-1:IMSS-A]GAT91570.1 hypothetical protein CL6EHI_153160 [Entamoeba histolytica]|eukprot:XP_656399.1 hypothetical protein EHI_153160 [Entamoeba histolytica HM-1:IMSS]
MKDEELRNSQLMPKVEGTDQKVQDVKTKRINKKGVQFSFVTPSTTHIMYSIIFFVLAAISIVLVPIISNTNNPVANISQYLSLFERNTEGLQEKYYVNSIKKNLHMETSESVKEEDYDADIAKNGIQNMYYLSQLGKNVSKEDVMKLYDGYGFIEDLEKIIEELEPEVDEFGQDDSSNDEEKEIIEKQKPQSILATYYAHEILKANNEFEKYKQTEQYLNTIKFVLTMQNNETGIIFDSKERYSDIEILYFAASLLEDAKNVKQYKEAVNNAINKLKEFLNKLQLLDGTFDDSLRQGNSSCVGTEYAYLIMKKLDMPIQKSTMQYIMKCNSVYGPLYSLDNNYVSIESALLISEILKTLPHEIQIEKVEVVDYCIGASIIFAGFAIASVFIDTFPRSYIQEYFVSVITFIICGIISIAFMDITLLPFLVFPIVIMGYTHYAKWIGPFIKDEYFSTISMVPALFGLTFYIIIQKFSLSFFISMKFIPFMWIIYIIGSYFAVPLCNNFFSKQKHGINYYVAANGIGFSMMIVCMFVTVSLSKNRVYILNSINVTGHNFILFVAYPAIGYILSMIACGFSIPKVSLASLAKEKKKD